MIAIVGAGRVGSEIAYSILENRIDDVTLIDLQADLAKGEALDMMQAATALEFDGAVHGTGDFSEMKGSDLVIIVAGQARKPDQTRIDLMNKNAQIVGSISKEVAKYAPDCKLLIVTNPMDIMTYVARRESGLPKNHVFGMGNILDSMRFRTYIAEELGVSREDTQALVIGEHGDSMVPLAEYACVAGVPISDLLSKEKIDGIIHKTVTSGADVIKLKGATVYAPAAAFALTTDAVVNDRKRVMSVSTCPSGEYGCNDFSIGVPVVLGGDGVERILELKLSSESQRRFDASVNALKAAISLLSPI